MGRKWQTLLQLAGAVSTKQVDLMAHALGWPDTKNLRRPGRVKWRNPYRNYFVSAIEDPNWERLIAVDLAVRDRSRDGLFGEGFTCYQVTALGRAVTTLHLRAHLEAGRLG